MKVHKENWGYEIEGNITEIINYLHTNWTSIPENAEAVISIVIKPQSDIEDIADERISRPEPSSPEQIADEMR